MVLTWWQKIPFLLFQFIFHQKLFLDEFTEIHMKRFQDPEATIRKYSTE